MLNMIKLNRKVFQTIIYIRCNNKTKEQSHNQTIKWNSL
jgi:hypothetical protein